MSKKLVKTNKSITGLRNSLKDDMKKIGIVNPDKPRLGNIYFLLDCSGSMSIYNKLTLAKKGAIGYADEANKKGYSIGLIKFGSIATHILEPKYQLENYKYEVNKLSTGGSTNMTDAIQQAIERFIDIIGEKIIFIVTDGMPDDKDSVLKAATLAKEKGIEIMTLGTDDADEMFLYQLSTRKEFSNKVSHDNLQQGIVSMAKLLSGPK